MNAMSLTKNEIKVINLLLRNFTERYSINGIARALGLSPMGAYKMLKKLEKNKILVNEKIGQGVYYEINLHESIGQKAAEFVLTASTNDLSPYARVCREDMLKSRSLTSCAGLFGSVLTKGMEANDVDIFYVAKVSDYKKLRKSIEEWQKTCSKPLHLFVQTKEDLVSNLKKKDAPLLDILKKCAFFWGQEVVVEAIKNVKNRE